MPSPQDVIAAVKAKRQRRVTPEQVAEEAVRQGVDPALAVSVAKQESRGRDAVSKVGARGPMQLMPGTAAQIAKRRGEVYNPDDLEQNVRFGVDELKRLSGKAGGDIEKIAKGYNWGEGNMNKRTMPGETRGWLAGVSQTHAELSAKLQAMAEQMGADAPAAPAAPVAPAPKPSAPALPAYLQDAPAATEAPAAPAPEQQPTPAATPSPEPSVQPVELAPAAPSEIVAKDEAGNVVPARPQVTARTVANDNAANAPEIFKDLGEGLTNLRTPQKGKISQFQRDVKLGAQPTSGEVMRGTDPTRQESRVSLDAASLLKSKDVQGAVMDQTAQQFGVNPEDYRGLVKAGILDHDTYTPQQVAQIRESAKYYSTVAGDKKLYLPVSDAQRQIVEAFKTGGYDAANQKRAEMDTASQRYVDSQHQVTPQEKSNIEAARQRAGRDAEIGSAVTGELNLARGITSALGLKSASDAIKSVTAPIEQQVAEGKKTTDLRTDTEKVAQGLLFGAPLGALRMMATGAAAAPLGIVGEAGAMGAQSYLQGVDKPFGERMKEAVTMAGMPITSRAAAPLIGALAGEGAGAALKNALGKTSTEAAFNVAQEIVSNPNAQKSDLIKAGILGGAFSAHEVVAGISSLITARQVKGGHIGIDDAPSIHQAIITNPEFIAASDAVDQSRAALSDLQQKQAKNASQVKAGFMPPFKDIEVKLQAATKAHADAITNFESVLSPMIEADRQMVPKTPEVAPVAPEVAPAAPAPEASAVEPVSTDKYEQNLLARTLARAETGKAPEAAPAAVEATPDAAAVETAKAAYHEAVKQFGVESDAAQQAWDAVKAATPEGKLKANKEKFFADPEADALLNRLGNEITSPDGVKKIDGFLRKKKITNVTAEDIASEFLPKDKAEADDIRAEWDKIGLPRTSVVQGEGYKTVAPATKGIPDQAARAITMEDRTGKPLLDAKNDQVSRESLPDTQEVSANDGFKLDTELRAKLKNPRWKPYNVESGGRDSARIAAKELQLPSKPKPELTGEISESRSSVPLEKIWLGDRALNREKLLTASENLKEGFKDSAEHEKIVITPDPKQPGNFIALEGQHRLAAAKLIGANDDVAVTIRTAKTAEKPLFGQSIARDPEYIAQQTKANEKEGDARWQQRADQTSNRSSSEQERREDVSPVALIRRELGTINPGMLFGEAKHLRESGIHGLISKKGKATINDVRELLRDSDYRLPDGRKFDEVYDDEVLQYLEDHGTTARPETVSSRNIDKQLADDEEAHYRKQEEYGNEQSVQSARLQGDSEGRAVAANDAGADSRNDGAIPERSANGKIDSRNANGVTDDALPPDSGKRQDSPASEVRQNSDAPNIDADLAEFDAERRSVDKSAGKDRLGSETQPEPSAGTRPELQRNDVRRSESGRDTKNNGIQPDAERQRGTDSSAGLREQSSDPTRETGRQTSDEKRDTSVLLPSEPASGLRRELRADENDNASYDTARTVQEVEPVEQRFSAPEPSRTADESPLSEADLAERKYYQEKMQRRAEIREAAPTGIHGKLASLARKAMLSDDGEKLPALAEHPDWKRVLDVTDDASAQDVLNAIAQDLAGVPRSSMMTPKHWEGTLEKFAGDWSPSLKEAVAKTLAASEMFSARRNNFLADEAVQKLLNTPIPTRGMAQRIRDLQQIANRYNGGQDDPSNISKHWLEGTIREHQELAGSRPQGDGANADGQNEPSAQAQPETQRAADSSESPESRSRARATNEESQPEVIQPSLLDEIAAKANEAATSPTNDTPEPTPAQIEAGNYKKPTINLHGLEIKIENPAGSVRSGTDANGRPWNVEMKNHYGYIRRTEGADGDQIDAYIGDNPESSKVFVVDQIDNQTGKFDEHKAILGADDQAGAEKLYDAHFSDGKGQQRRGAITEMSTQEFKDWLKTDTTKPIKFSEDKTSEDLGANSKKSPETKISEPANLETGKNLKEETTPANALMAKSGSLPGGISDTIAQQRLEQARAQLATAKTEIKRKALQDDIAKYEKQLSKNGPEAAQQPHAVIEKNATDAIERLRASKEAGFMDIGALTPDFVHVAAAHIAKGGQAFGKWSTEMISQFGNKVRKVLRTAWDQAQALVKKSWDNAGDPNVRSSGPNPLEPIKAAANLINKSERKNIPAPAHFDIEAYTKKAIKAIRLKGLEGDQLSKAEDGLEAVADAIYNNDGHALIAARRSLAEMLTTEAPSLKSGKGLKKIGLEVMNLPRTIKASIDFSAPLRQGAISSLNILNLQPSRRRAEINNWRKMFTSMGEQAYLDFEAELSAHPRADLADKAGLYRASSAELDFEGRLTGREEQYMSHIAGNLPIMKHSERAYKVYLDMQRMASFDRMVKSLEADGHSQEFESFKDWSAKPENRKLAKDLGYQKMQERYEGERKTALRPYVEAADFINKATGRGTIPQMMESLAPVLNGALFSPRYLASRFQMMDPRNYLNAIPGVNLQSKSFYSKPVAKKAFTELAGFVSTVAMMAGMAAAGGAQISRDPDSPDFLKLKWGKYRYDLAAGFQQDIRFLWKIGASFRNGRKDGVDVAKHFLRTKLAPVPGVAVDAWTGKDMVGDKATWGHETAQLIAPLLLKDIYEGFKDDGAKGMLKMTPGIFGVGVQQYEAKGQAAYGQTPPERQKAKSGALEPEDLYNKRVERARKWTDQYGNQLFNSERFKRLDAAGQKKIQTLFHERVLEQTHLKEPNTEKLTQSAIWEAVENAKPTDQSGKLWAH